MFKKALLAAAILGTSLSASANWELGVGFGNFSDSDDGVDLSLGGLMVSGGYQFDLTESVSLTPQLRYGIGLQDDEVSGIDVELDNFYALSVKAQTMLGEGVYAYLVPSYGKVELTGSAGGFSISADSDWEFGYGAGLGYMVSDTAWLEVSYESFDGTDLLSFGAKFTF
ncbi:outer membrane beta-barrel protein [Alteromonas sp. KUL49]|uniref:outer membrane beta-barrel protein n=1 Tax=Alteromonas sp. KUL49 TaxID=2480798 RepID=UPI0010FFB107|nr:outer membrane beta-barrel protein [Alteromonas sp. KUL49]GEA11955.1 hypothetical protein KUL49_23300 [Alteromonas sp. KUL49]